MCDVPSSPKRPPSSHNTQQSSSSEGATDKVEAGFAEQAAYSLLQARGIWKASWVLTGIGVVMVLVGGWVLWQVSHGIVDDLKGLSPRDARAFARTLEVVVYPAIYIVTVWFAPALIALVCGSCLRWCAEVLRQSAKQYMFMALAMPTVIAPHVKEDGGFRDMVERLDLSPREGLRKKLSELMAD